MTETQRRGRKERLAAAMEQALELSDASLAARIEASLEFAAVNPAAARALDYFGAPNPYLRRNLSTRPAVSMIFCWPVKNG
jgi:hypothetical protein